MDFFSMQRKMFDSVICHVTIYMKPRQLTNLMKSNYCARGYDQIIHKFHIHYHCNCLLQYLINFIR